MQCGMINSNISAVIKVEMFTVNLLRQLEVKYYIVKVIIVQCVLSIKLKNRPFPTYVYINSFICSDVKYTYS